MTPTAITVEGLGKAYRLGVQQQRADTLVGAIGATLKAPFRNFRKLSRLNTFDSERDSEDTLWALKDISFEVKVGEVVGLVGRNGAGKSTLLKVLSRIADPTEGEATIRGRVSSLLEVGTGFHPELTGRENVYMNGCILGMKKREIDRKFDEIVAFSGVERFLDTPVKRYSSGMKVRLGFSVAAHLEPEVLIVDEVLAVGDAEFQQKCLGKMQNVAGSGRTVLFVSHNMGAIQNLCTRAISLRDGRIIMDGDCSEVVSHYLATMIKPESGGITLDNPERAITGDIHLTGGRLLDDKGTEVSRVDSGSAATFEFGYANPQRHRNFKLRIIIKDTDGVAIYALHSGDAGFNFQADREGTLRVTVPRLGLPLGRYVVATAVITADHQVSDRMPNALFFSVETSSFFPTGRTPPRRFGRALIEQSWEAVETTATPAQ